MARSYSYTEKVTKKRFIFFIIFVVIFTIILHNLITSFAFKTYRIQTKNMQPTFEKGTVIGATPIFKTEALKRGDLVFRKPIHKSNLNILQKFINKICSLFSANIFYPFGKDQSAISNGAVFRVIGLPGDTIYVDKFIAYIKDQKNVSFLTEFELSTVDYDILISQDLKNWESNMPFSGSSKQIVLGKDEFFLMSDNRIATLDSRLSGKCNKEDISEKIIFVTWPIKSWKRF